MKNSFFLLDAELIQNWKGRKDYDIEYEFKEHKVNKKSLFENL